MPRELRRTYPALKREWLAWGRVRRLDNCRGIPDFLLTLHKRPGVPIFAEVKAVAEVGAAIGLKPAQAHRLADFDTCGLQACVIVHIAEERWACWRGPFLTPDLKVMNLWDSARLRFGKELAPALMEILL